MKLPLPFATYALEATQASAKRLVNCAIEMLPDGKSQLLLRRTPGIKAWTTAGTRGRGLHTDPATGTLYAASGDRLYKISSNGAASELGAIAGSGPVSMDSNVDSVVCVTNPHAYYYNGTFGQITDPDYTARGASHVCFLGNWMLFLEPDSGRVFGANFGTVRDFDALKFFTAEGSPDNTRQILSDKQQLAQLGATSTEIAYNSGGTGFPFERVPSGGDFNLGTGAAYSAALADNSFIWLASDRTVRVLRGVTPTRVSTHAIEEQIRGLTRKDDATGFSYTLDGHISYVLTFPTDGRTFVYDFTSQQWHERSSRGGAWAPVSYAFAYGRHLVQDASGRIGELDPRTFKEWDDPQIVSWTYPTIYSDNKLAFHDRLEIVTEKGVGLLIGQGVKAEMMLEVSDDGGKTWRMYPTRSMGAMGQYNAVTGWDRCGSSKQRAYRASCSDPITAVISDTLWYGRGGRL